MEGSASPRACSWTAGGRRRRQGWKTKQGASEDQAHREDYHYMRPNQQGKGLVGVGSDEKRRNGEGRV